MQTKTVTTPFGRRPMSLALVKSQLDTKGCPARHPICKWRVFRDICEARETLRLHDRTLAVLDALLSFYPEPELSCERNLVVFPSNAQLSLRAHGIAGTTLRRHLAALVEAGIVHRQDSPNGKRYAHRDETGSIEKAFGFSLEPLIAHAAEFARMAQQVADERRLFRLTKESLTICRRDVRKLISMAVEEGADGDWEAIEGQYIALVARLGRSPARHEMAIVLGELEMLREEIVNRLEIQSKIRKTDGSDGQSGRHIQNSNPESVNELEPGPEPEPEVIPQTTPKRMAEPLATFPLRMVLRACPQFADYGPGGLISNWREMIAAAVLVRSMLGVSPSAYQEACEIMGAENAATVIACILERTTSINSAGGYLRYLSRRATRGEFSLGPMLMALIRARPYRADERPEPGRTPCATR
ncbi:replication initiation protein RepC [Rhizobium daejeonense]|uniref:Replication initiation protein RepC n=1 Tax=Rhizobium daejeonense TaxID=240521 RepID=A0A6M1SAX4_9HYPH|nr:plasmid replication protein RepC [Rhizobium daejeonense]NGO66637.1 replication initiation protein RepC [Rhizobium daejeonense]